MSYLSFSIKEVVLLGYSNQWEIGIVLIVLGAKMKGPYGQRSGGGIAMLTIGIVIIIVGAI